MPHRAKTTFACLTIILIISVGWNFFSGLAGFLQPDLVAQRTEMYRRFPSNILIKKLNEFNYVDILVASNILAERKESAAVPKLIKIASSRSIFKDKAIVAITALKKIGDDRAVKPLLEIARRGDHNSLFHYYALDALVSMDPKDVFPHVIRWAQREDGYRNGSIGLLKQLDKPEALPVLHEMKHKLQTKEGDSWNVNFARKELSETIVYLSRTREESSHRSIQFSETPD